MLGLRSALSLSDIPLSGGLAQSAGVVPGSSAAGPLPPKARRPSCEGRQILPFSSSVVPLRGMRGYLTLHFLTLALFACSSVPICLTAQRTVQDRLQQAAQLLSEQKFQAAREALEDLLNSAGEKVPPQTYYQLALCYVKQAEWKKAEEALQVFLQVAPENFSALYLKGFVLFSSGRYEKSLRVLEPLVSRMTSRNPEHAATHKVIGLDQFMLGRADLAEAELKRAVGLAPQDAEAHYYLGRVHFMRDDLAGALAAFQKATELDASSVKAHNHLGQTYEALVQYPAARAAYLKAIELEKRQNAKSEWPYFNLGALCLREGRAAEAEGYLREALERQPGWSEGKAKLGMALLALDRPAEALSYLEQAVQIDPQNADARYQYARLLVKIGKQDEAERHFQLFQQQKNP
jgi:tetratricopeptide (TPR) repeat protein